MALMTACASTKGCRDHAPDPLAAQSHAGSTSKVAHRNSSQTAFQFENNKGVTWWKAIVIVDKHGKKTWLHRSGQPGVTHASNVFVADDFDNDKVTVEFWKAKAFGVHTYVGKANITFESIKGHVVRFQWMNG